MRFGGSRFRGFLKRKIRDWMAPMERFIFGAICRGFIPEASSFRSISSSVIVQGPPAGRGPVIFPLPFPSLLCDEACSIFGIGRESLSLFLVGKVSHRNAVPLDGPPSFRRPMRPGLYRHYLIGFVEVVVSHFPLAFRFPVPTARTIKLESAADRLTFRKPLVGRFVQTLLRAARIRKMTN